MGHVGLVVVDSTLPASALGTLEKIRPNMGPHPRAGVFLALCITGTDVISARIIKPGVQRFRPSHSIELRDEVHLVTPPGQDQPYRGGRFGFVSSHAANYTGIALYFGLLLGGGAWLWVLLGWAAIIGYSRMYLGVHFPLDIAGGMLLGAFIGYVMWRIQNKLVGTPINLE